MNSLQLFNEFMNDDSVTELMIVGEKGVWIEIDGELILTDLLINESELHRIVEQIISPLGLHVDRMSPMVDGRLPDGSRVNVVIPPVALDGTCMTLRRFPKRNLILSDFADDDCAAIALDIVRKKRNIIVSGGTGSGKTSLVNCLSHYFKKGERVVTIEETAELNLAVKHIVRLEARPSNTEGVGEISIADLVRNALRMRPDRLLIGEVRGGETADLLQALHTGHTGSISTCHANTAQDALLRLEVMSLMSMHNLSFEIVRRQIGRAINYVVHLSRLPGGGRRITEILECIPGDVPHGKVIYQL